MSRLTKEFTSCEYCEDVDCTGYKNSCMHRKVYDKLVHYEDMEEQGRLIELPCKPDEIVYAVHEDCKMVKVAYASIEHILADIEAGWCIGYTKEEAEAKLEELKGK